MQVKNKSQMLLFTDPAPIYLIQIYVKMLPPRLLKKTTSKNYNS